MQQMLLKMSIFFYPFCVLVIPFFCMQIYTFFLISYKNLGLIFYHILFYFQKKGIYQYFFVILQIQTT